MKRNKILLVLVTAVLLLTSYVSPTFAYENLEHFKTLSIENRTPEGCRFRSGVLTIGRTFNDRTLNGTVQHRIFGTSEDVRKCYEYGAYVNILEVGLRAQQENSSGKRENTGKVGSYSPEDTGGSTLHISDAVFNWLDWTNVASLTVKVLSNDFRTEIRATQPSGTIHTRRIRASNTFGIDHADLPASVSSRTADRGVQNETLGLATYFDVTMYDEFGKLQTKCEC